MRHNVRTRLFLGGQFRDITDKVYQRDPIEIERGRGDESSETNPQTCSMTLDNRSGEFSMRNPMGPWFGALNRNVPLEVAYSVTTDVFDRAVVNSWGSDDNGNVWSLATTGNVPVPTGADFEVSNGVGRVRLPAGDSFRRTYLNDVQFTNVDVTTSFTTTTGNITGGSVFPGNLGIRGTTGTSDYIYASVEIDTSENILAGIVGNIDGTVYAASVDTGINHAAGQNISVRLQAEGSTARVKVWVTSAGEPLEWTATSTIRVPVRRGFVSIRTTSSAGNTNANITFDYDNFRVDSMRFTGEVSNWPSGSDVSGKDRYVSIEAAGILRRLGQGKSPQRSTLREGLGNRTDLAAYWPCEDGKTSTSIASAFPGHPSMTVTGSPAFAEYDNFDSTEPMPLVKGSSWVGEVPDYTHTGAIQLRFILAIPEGGMASNVPLISVETPGTAARISLEYSADVGGGEGANLQVHDSDGVLLYNLTAGFEMDGKEMYWTIQSVQNGPNVDIVWGYFTYTNPGFFPVNATVNNKTIGRATRVRVNPSHSSLLDDTTFGHIVVRASDVPIGTEVGRLFHAYRDERALARMIRLCTANGIPFTYVLPSSVDDTVIMGPQRVDTLVNQLRECEATDMGTLFEPRGTLGLTYRSRTSMYTQTPALTLNVANNELAAPFRPVEDDAITVNDVEVKNVNGTSAREELSTGRMSVQDYPNGVGRYDSVFDVNVHNDIELPDHASFRLAKGTVDEARWPDLSVDLDATPQHIPAVLDLNVDDLLVITAAGAVGIYDDIRQLVRGYRETFTNHRFIFSVNASPATPYDILALDSADARLDSDSSSLTAGITSSALSFQVTSTAELWTRAAGDFPLDILVGGERMTVSAISSATSPQTFTISARSVNGVTKSHGAGTAVHVANVSYLGL